MTPDDMVNFFSIIDPQSVLELVEIAETRISDKEVSVFHEVIANLADYIHPAAAGSEADKVLLWARQIVGVPTR